MRNSESRVTVEKTDHSIKVSIRAYKNDNKQKLLLVWVTLWTACGFYMFNQYFWGDLQNDLKTFLIIWGGFWAYFEYKVVYAYRWRSSGKEVIEITENRLSVWRMIGKRGMPRHYSIDFIKDLRLIEDNAKNFFKVMNNSYWVVAGETIGFDYQGRLVGFGLQLEAKEASALCSMLKHEVKQRKEG